MILIGNLVAESELLLINLINCKTIGLNCSVLDSNDSSCHWRRVNLDNSFTFLFEITVYSGLTLQQKIACNVPIGCYICTGKIE